MAMTPEQYAALQQTIGSGNSSYFWDAMVGAGVQPGTGDPREQEYHQYLNQYGQGGTDFDSARDSLATQNMNQGLSEFQINTGRLLEAQGQANPYANYAPPALPTTGNTGLPSTGWSGVNDQGGFAGQPGTGPGYDPGVSGAWTSTPGSSGLYAPSAPSTPKSGIFTPEPEGDLPTASGGTYAFDAQNPWFSKQPIWGGSDLAHNIPPEGMEWSGPDGQGLVPTSMPTVPGPANTPSVSNPVYGAHSLGNSGGRPTFPSGGGSGIGGVRGLGPNIVSTALAPTSLTNLYRMTR